MASARLVSYSPVCHFASLVYIFSVCWLLISGKLHSFMYHKQLIVMWLCRITHSPLILSCQNPIPLGPHVCIYICCKNIPCVFIFYFFCRKRLNKHWDLNTPVEIYLDIIKNNLLKLWHRVARVSTQMSKNNDAAVKKDEKIGTSAH